jgi:hypothetical protein
MEFPKSSRQGEIDPIKNLNIDSIYFFKKIKVYVLKKYQENLKDLDVNETKLNKIPSFTLFEKNWQNQYKKKVLRLFLVRKIKK